jgi:hypothetical protein
MDRNGVGLRVHDPAQVAAGERVRAAIAALDRFGGAMDRVRAARLLPEWWRAPALTRDEVARVLAHFPEATVPHVR